VFYETTTKNLKAFPRLAKLPLDEINSAIQAQYIAKRHIDGLTVASINAELRTLKRTFNLAEEWRPDIRLPKVTLLPGEEDGCVY
jgi:hypothetical protein